MVEIQMSLLFESEKDLAQFRAAVSMPNAVSALSAFLSSYCAV
jgi:hypothetical protein